MTDLPDKIYFSLKAQHGNGYYIASEVREDEKKNLIKYMKALPLRDRVVNIIFKHWRGEIAEYTALIKEIDKLFEE